MKIGEYLKEKYKGTAIAISSSECRVLRINYPLESGWLADCSDREITEKQVAELVDLLTHSAKLAGRNKYKSAGLRVLRGEVAIEKPVLQAKKVATWQGKPVKNRRMSPEKLAKRKEQQAAWDAELSPLCLFTRRDDWPGLLPGQTVFEGPLRQRSDVPVFVAQQNEAEAFWRANL